ncbi:MAG: TolC family protein [Helicobacter sp.]|uniref:Cobalt transporter n=1 Tax=Helicobacter equorum TaxID=361872 RepID=A0A3D8INL3_9HELI|nr:TolC family protein [Helicobacter equorum]MCI6312569.1 TolC family protein [Helicobacter sp.]MDY2823488.1 TolC family protein [Helicobacter sp.]RDU66839.1 cobalt transporter [Helicobacter equorum]
MKIVYKIVFCVCCVSAFVSAQTPQKSTQTTSPSLSMADSVHTMSVDEFLERIEQNSVMLAKSQAYAKSLIYEGKAARAWNSPYTDVSSMQVRSPSGGNELETEAYFMLAPRLPWVSSILRQMYETRYIRAQKNYELTKRLSVISIKRLYLDYLAQKEQFRVYEDRLSNAKEQLDIAKVRFDAGRISRSQYLFFRSDFLSVQVMYENSKKNLANTLNAIKVGLGIVDSSIDIEVSGLVFSYITLSDTDIESKLQDSLYLEIVALDIADYANSAKFASRSRFDSVEIGAGANIAESNTGAAFKVKIPLPLTTKYGNQKAMYLALQSGSVRESEILKNTLQSNAHSYLKQLEMKKNAISVAQADEENKKNLTEISKIGYEAGKTSVFEYLLVKNNYLDSMIATIEAKRDYNNTLAMLEESLAQVLILENLNNKE